MKQIVGSLIDIEVGKNYLKVTEKTGTNASFRDKCNYSMVR